MLKLKVFKVTPVYGVPSIGKRDAILDCLIITGMLGDFHHWLFMFKASNGKNQSCSEVASEHILEREDRLCLSAGTSDRAPLVIP